MATTAYDTTKVHLYDGANELATITPSGDSWSQVNVSLSSGDHDVKVKGEDKAGNTSGFRTVNIITGNATTPIVDLLDDTGESSTDNYTADNTPGLDVSVTLPTPTGSVGPAATSVNKLALWRLVGAEWEEYMITSANHNAFSATFTPASALGDGDHSFKAKWQDKYGNWSILGALLTITIDTQSPTAPTIDNLTDGQIIVGTTVNVNGTIF